MIEILRRVYESFRTPVLVFVIAALGWVILDYRFLFDVGDFLGSNLMLFGVSCGAWGIADLVYGGTRSEGEEAALHRAVVNVAIANGGLVTTPVIVASEECDLDFRGAEELLEELGRGGFLSPAVAEDGSWGGWRVNDLIALPDDGPVRDAMPAEPRVGTQIPGR